MITDSEGDSSITKEVERYANRSIARFGWHLLGEGLQYGGLLLGVAAVAQDNFNTEQAVYGGLLMVVGGALKYVTNTLNREDSVKAITAAVKDSLNQEARRIEDRISLLETKIDPTTECPVRR